MPIDPVPTGPVETAPRGHLPEADQHAQLLAVLTAAGVELGAYDERLAKWLAGWDWSTVATITSWVQRATDPLTANATEYRIHLPDGGGTELRLSRQAPGHDGGWAACIPRRGGGVAWTREGWQESISALSVDRLFCWPDAPTALSEARRALGSPTT